MIILLNMSNGSSDIAVSLYDLVVSSCEVIFVPFCLAPSSFVCSDFSSFPITSLEKEGDSCLPSRFD